MTSEQQIREASDDELHKLAHPRGSASVEVRIRAVSELWRRASERKRELAYRDQRIDQLEARLRRLGQAAERADAADQERAQVADQLERVEARFTATRNEVRARSLRSLGAINAFLEKEDEEPDAASGD